MDGFAERLMTWQRQYGRHHLPWQGTNDPYRIWLSEIMLQQTQVSAVLGYFERFVERFPTLTALAEAPTDAVMALWSGLGYYSRARNLHRCAQIIVHDYGGQFPDSLDELAKLPGIGRSTAGAIATFAFGKRVPILDGNVKRVLARTFGVDGYPGAKPVEMRLWHLAESLLPTSSTRADLVAYTQGLMDLGATTCTRSQPVCLQDPALCPFSTGCIAFQLGKTADWPTPKPTKVLPRRSVIMLIVRSGGRFWLERRASKGIWGGLWSPPEWVLPGAVTNSGFQALPFTASELATARKQSAAMAAEYGVVERTEWLDVIEHTFTHFRLQIRPLQVTIDDATAPTRPNQRWLAFDELAQVGMPAPIRSLLEKLGAQFPAPTT